MHQPVLVEEVVELLRVRPGGAYIDATVGGGGHAMAILDRAGADGRLLGIDRDRDALDRARAHLAARAQDCVLTHGNFADMAVIAGRCGFPCVDGVLMDLGVSSEQLDTPERGFSFMVPGPLDMRMDRSSELTAERFVNTADEHELRDTLRQLGEEPRAGRIARAILEARSRAPLRTTTELSAVVERAVGGRRGRLHPATRTFQAIRIAVNRELECVREGLEAGLGLIMKGGRMAVITFHSLEDRLVKHFFRLHAGREESLAAGGVRWVGNEPAVALVNRRVVTPSEDELRRNPRSRSAKLRVVERL